VAYGTSNRSSKKKENLDRHLKIDNPLDSHLKPVKIGDNVTGLLLADNQVFVENEPTVDKHIATKKYVDDNSSTSTPTMRWTNTSGGYKTNNNSASNYYFQNYPNYHSWANADSSPTTINIYDCYSYQWCAPASGTLTNISVSCRAADTGLTDPLKFYVYKGAIGNEATTTSLTLIGTTGTITPVSAKQMFLSTDISSSNDFAAGDKLWVMYKKDSTSGNQDLYFAVTISGEYD
tara:strand:+ start:380 stop:1081 length:702 start_codon:yes stop_codon:yes gene_type:complete